jgi:hypothetical protein
MPSRSCFRQPQGHLNRELTEAKTWITGIFTQLLILIYRYFESHVMLAKIFSALQSIVCESLRRKKHRKNSIKIAFSLLCITFYMMFFDKVAYIYPTLPTSLHTRLLALLQKRRIVQTFGQKTTT